MKHALDALLGAPGRAILMSVLLSVPLVAQSRASAPQASRSGPLRSTANPFAGLRGNSARGLATQGASRRGISGRASARPGIPVEAHDPAWRRAPARAHRFAPPPPPPPGGPPAASRPGAPLDRSRPRLLTLANGSVLRGRARLSKGHWRILTRSGWRQVPRAEVLRVELERDVLAEARARRRRMDREDPDARIELATWMLHEGLPREAMAGILDLDAPTAHPTPHQ